MGKESGVLAQVMVDIASPQPRPCGQSMPSVLPGCLEEMGIEYRNRHLCSLSLCLIEDKASLAGSYKVIFAKGLWPKAIKSDLNRVIIHS
jgi:hypothetical protein